VNVSYVPSQNSPIWNEYESERASTERLRAIAATAARHGMLAVARDEAKNFADRVRQMKRYDPTLGIYAVVAYADLGLRDDAESVQDYMRRDLDADIFDIALLAGTMKKYLKNNWDLPTVPFCPMLSQTWSFLRPRGVELPSVLAQAGHHRRSALWTTFEAEAMSLLREAAKLGELP
jgi:hypothetical protein